jgi:3'-phosphoadenosine 5'-phosphosulfate sulfotransferase (PAPS reductase)/FAD synthetase
MSAKKTRHVLGLSGGKDSAALAIYLHEKIPEMEYFFCDTHKELPETYDFLDRLKARLGIKIKYLSAERGFDHWLEVFNGFLPSAKMRWCTKQLKLRPFEEFVGDDEVVSYVGIRADEEREGYLSTKPNIKAIFPFKEDGLVKADIIRLLEESGIGMPSYYRWRTRSGCFFCFFQRKYEWVKLAEEHPDLFAQAVKYEQQHNDGRTYLWNENESLTELLLRKDQIIANHEMNLAKEVKVSPNKPLAEVLEDLLDSQDFEIPCLVCTL